MVGSLLCVLVEGGVKGGMGFSLFIDLFIVWFYF